MSDRLREATKEWQVYFRDNPAPDGITVYLAWVEQAARRFLALTETGPEWVCQVYGMIDDNEREECFDWHLSEKVGRSKHHEQCGWFVLIPADYLTEETE